MDRAHHTEHRMYDASENVVRDDMRIRYREYATELHVMSAEATPEEILGAVIVHRKERDKFSKKLAEIAAFLASKETSREFVLKGDGEREFVFRVTKDY